MSQHCDAFKEGLEAFEWRMGLICVDSESKKSFTDSVASTGEGELSSGCTEWRVIGAVVTSSASLLETNVSVSSFPTEASLISVFANVGELVASS